ncbi:MULTISPECIES: hypothetical protein [Burkholderia]|uniref:hypothetical protein n=1 Tax=Burkholderia TaxID=32008 RepID=UPI0011A8D88A|nr:MULTISPECIES: hypothetical protein [Burkholderia]MDN7736198.1 hypothetical protein [Burkholderia gladioli]
MRMQESLFSVEEGGQLRLSGSLSEWLFSSKFWSDFNAKCSTMFDQYEEDEADVSVVKTVIIALEARARALQELDVRDVEFVYRWTAKHKPLKASVSREALLSELMTLRDFLCEAVARNRSVILSL